MSDRVKQIKAYWSDFQDSDADDLYIARSVMRHMVGHLREVIAEVERLNEIVADARIRLDDRRQLLGEQGAKIERLTDCIGRLRGGWDV